MGWKLLDEDENTEVQASGEQRIYTGLKVVMCGPATYLTQPLVPTYAMSRRHPFSANFETVAP